MKTLIPILIGLLVVGCGTTPKVVLIPNTPKALSSLNRSLWIKFRKPKGEITQTDCAKVDRLSVEGITDLSVLTKFTELESLSLVNPHPPSMSINLVSGKDRVKMTDSGNPAQPPQFQFQQPIDMSTLSRFKKLKSLRLGFYNFSDGSFFSELTDLKDLDIQGAKLTQRKLRNLTKAPQLETLKLTSCEVTDVSALSEMMKLKNLNLDNNPKINLETVSKLIQAEGIDLSYNQLNNLDALKSLTSLKRLDLSSNPKLTRAQIDELQAALPQCFLSHDLRTEQEKIELVIRRQIGKPTGELTKADYEKVTDLSVQGDQLTDLKGLEKLTELKTLSLAYNKLTSVKSLEKLTQLHALRLDGNQLTSVKGLEKLTQLKRLSLKNNPDLTKAQIDELQKALPKCKIEHNAKK